MTIKAGKVVDLSYSLTNDKGEILDKADGNDPFTYLHGASQVVPGLESALEGLKQGDKKKVSVSPEQGYGKKDPNLKLAVARTQFPPTLDLKAGMQFEADTGDGQEMMFTVESIQGDKVHIDGNHPLAGQTLHFDVEVLTVRDATEEEMSHGHAHGPDGHGHDHDHDHDHDHEDEEDGDGEHGPLH
jgi:FKBP-type peptidyl-prolyl cis-trans isomerase SlyD